MKAAPFEYSRARDIDEACALLADDDGARVIAGGQTLVPMMAMRLARPTRLVDINRIAALSYIREDGDAVAIGATTRQCAIERDALVKMKLPLLARAVPFIGHTATRARGTIGGSLANADPAAELALVAVTLQAKLGFRENGKDGEIAAEDFFVGPMTTALPAGACLSGARFPVWRGKTGIGFEEINSRRGDFAFVAAAAQLELGGDGTCKRIAVGIGAATDFPIRLQSAEKQLTGTMLDEAKVRDAVRAALAAVELNSDLHASADYRRRAAVNLACRAIAGAKAGAQGRRAHAH